MSESFPRTKSGLMDQLRASQAEMDRVLTSLTDAQMNDAKDHVGWSVKDHIVHLALWQRGVAAMLRKEPRWAAMGVDRQTVTSICEDELNQIMRAQHADKSPAEAIALLRAAHDELLAAMESLSTADLEKTYSHYQPDEPGEDSGRPIAAWIIGNGSGHYAEHLPWMLAIIAPK